MARYDPDWVRAHYDEYGMREWDRWDESPVERVKFHVHLHYLRRYVKAGDRVLEIGAGAGRFTRELAGIVDRIVVAERNKLDSQSILLSVQPGLVYGHKEPLDQGDCRRRIFRIAIRSNLVRVGLRHRGPPTMILVDSRSPASASRSMIWACRSWSL